MIYQRVKIDNGDGTSGKRVLRYEKYCRDDDDNNNNNNNNNNNTYRNGNAQLFRANAFLQERILAQ